MKKTPTHDQAHGAFENHITNGLDYTTGQRNSKAEANLRAILALNGHSVYVLRTDGYLISKWGYTHHARDIESLEAFAVKLGAFHE